MGGSNVIEKWAALEVWNHLRLFPDVSCQSVADTVGLSNSTVRRIERGEHPGIQGLGKPRGDRRCKPPCTKDQVAMVIGKFVQGERLNDIARDCNLGATTIARILDGKHRYSRERLR